MMDAFTSSDAYPYARHYRLGRHAGQLPAEQRQGGGRRLRRHGRRSTSSTRRPDHRAPTAACFPSLFADAATMPAGVRAHVRYPELLLKVQAAVFALYHMRDPDVFYNREDLWSVASEVTLSESREQVTRPLEPNFVLMKLPGRGEPGVRRDPAVHAVEPQQPDRLDRRPERRRRVRQGARLRLPQDAARRRPAAGRGPHRPERRSCRRS